jgi:transcriptional regulator with XRE-family HTH domain
MAEAIRRARKAADLTQEEFGEALGVSRQRVSEWENGAPVGADSAERFAALFPDTVTTSAVTPARREWAGGVRYSVAAMMRTLATLIEAADGGDVATDQAEILRRIEDPTPPVSEQPPASARTARRRAAG